MYGLERPYRKPIRRLREAHLRWLLARWRSLLAVEGQSPLINERLTLSCSMCRRGHPPWHSSNLRPGMMAVGVHCSPRTRCSVSIPRALSRRPRWCPSQSSKLWTMSPAFRPSQLMRRYEELALKCNSIYLEACSPSANVILIAHMSEAGSLLPGSKQGDWSPAALASSGVPAIYLRESRPKEST